MANDPTDIAKSFMDKLTEGFNELKFKIEDFTDGIEYMVASAEKVSKTFGIGRTRMVELMGAITEATPAIDKLGGNLKNVEDTINAVAQATSTNVVAGEKTISKLFAAQSALDLETKRTVENFQKIGVNFTQVGTQLETSLNYIQSVGGNAQQIMQSIVEDMSAMNRFNFQNGIEGFTKMATQAAMLKFDMRETLDLANEALDPDRAIELASSFQRLGVSVGELTDPFQLMNMSLNDPEGLQNSIVEMSKQFTSFDEKTKSFKINPQGMLMMREIQKQTGLSAQELSKMALNASELDRKLSQISPSINFTKEEDRKLLANIATMRPDGKYEIAYGEDDKIELEKLTQDQVNELIKQQAKAPKTLEDLQRSQMDTMKLMKADLQAIKDKVVYGVVSPRYLRTGIEGGRQTGVAFTESAEEVSPSLKAIRGATENTIEGIKSLISTMTKEGTFGPESMKVLQTQLAKLDKLGESGAADAKVQELIGKFLEKNADNTTDIGKMFQKLLIDDVKKDGVKTTKTQTQSTDVGKGASHIGEVIKETNVGLLSKMEEANKLAKDGNDKLGSISDGMNKATTPNTKDNTIGGVISETFITAVTNLKDAQIQTNQGLTTLTDVMKKMSPTTIQNANTSTNNTTSNVAYSNQSNINKIEANPINATDIAKVTTNTTNRNYTIGFNSDQPATVNVNIKLNSDGTIDANMLSNIMDKEAMKEKITNTVITKLKEVEFQPLIDAMKMG